ncbi:MAG: flavin reductase family protein [Alphaproteobacteria bacterium]|nr:flavin reductase family protein [Alphaproteobacteria bacterium]
MSITADQFRKTLGLFATGVTVVTTPQGGEDVGITISSLTSVSLNPPQILFCLSKQSKAAPVFKECPYFSINILNANQAYIADLFARHLPSNREMLKAFRDKETGCLLLSDALGHVLCERGKIYDGGDHHIILGHVINVKANFQDLPLVRQKGQYLTTQPIPMEEPLQKACSL